VSRTVADIVDERLPRVRAPWSIGSLRVPHRIVMGSMHTGLETRDDGGAALAAFYAERVAGGAGLIITGGLAVNSAGRGGPDYAILDRGDTQARLAFAVQAVHAAGGLIAAQLFHAGRYAILTGLTNARGEAEQAVAPSAVPWRVARGTLPRELREREIHETISDFAVAASVAVDAGFDAVEIMASEGYLINQFCSPRTNLRDDAWGGDSARRRHFAVAVVDAVRAAIPDAVPVLVRMSGDDLMPDSSTPQEVSALAVACVDAGADALSVGMGWHESTVPTVQATVPHGAWLRYAERIAAAIETDGSTRVPVIASNRITDLREAERALGRGIVDAVALARPFLADPSIVARSLAGNFEHVNTCIGCDQACIDRSLVFQPVSCLVNPRAGREVEFPVHPDEAPRRIAVVGAGPAGLEAALDLAERGHGVTLFEAAEDLGGQFTLAASIPGKEDYARTPDSALNRLRDRGAAIRTATSATPQLLAGFDGVILATGVVPREVEIPGAQSPHVLSYERAIRDGVPAGRVAIIGGGGIGVDIATFLIEQHDPAGRADEFTERFGLAESAAVLDERHGTHTSRRAAVTPRAGNLVTMLRRSGGFGHGIGITTRWVVLGALRAAGVRMLTELRYRAITPAGVEIEHADGRVELIEAATVILCAGQESHNPLADALAGTGIRFEIVGGARDARGVDAVRATSEGLEAARRLTGRLARSAGSVTE
jgi:2,4-dienoyl-CoA reductase (NADPH2)